MPTYVVGQPCFYSALFANLFQDIITCTVARNMEDTIIPAVTLVFLNDSFGYFQ